MVKGGNKMKEISSFTLDDFLDLPKNELPTHIDKSIYVVSYAVF